MTVAGLPIAIEYPAGSTKLGEDDAGKKWARVYLLDYGFIEGGPNSIDGETMDVYVGPHHDALYVYVVNQLKKDGSLDEHKCMLGFRDQSEALEGYLRHYPAGWEKDRVQSVKTLTVEEFKRWIKGSGVTKAAAMKVARPEQFDTPAFKAWFGDSKVVDSEGRPLRVFHGTARDFDTFDMGQQNSNYNGSWRFRGREGFFFASHPDEAEDVAYWAEAYNDPLTPSTRGLAGANIKPVYLSIQNPYVRKSGGAWTQIWYDNNWQELQAKCKAKGCDGIIIVGTGKAAGRMMYVVFSPAQIKSALANTGTFDFSNPRITASAPEMAVVHEVLAAAEAGAWRQDPEDLLKQSSTWARTAPHWTARRQASVRKRVVLALDEHLAERARTTA